LLEDAEQSHLSEFDGDWSANDVKALDELREYQHDIQVNCLHQKGRSI
jgi:hypothetical protein